MNKLYLLILFVVSSITLQAQLQEQKNTTPTNNINSTRAKTVFAPKTITFQASSTLTHDGLKAITQDNNQAILIAGTPLTQRRSENEILDVAKDYLFSAAPIMGITNSDEEMQYVKADVDELGMHHIKYQQVYNRIPVYGAEVILHGEAGNINMLMGRYEQTPTIDTEPTLSLAEARITVANHIGEITLPTQDIYNLFDIDPIATELVIYEGQLAYHSTVYKNLVDRSELFTDAHTGEIINEYKSFCKFHNHSVEGSVNSCTHSYETTTIEVKHKTSLAPSGAEIANATDLLGVTRTINTYEQDGTYYMLDVSNPEMFNSNSNLPNEPIGVIVTLNAFNSTPQIENNFQYGDFTSVNNSWNNTPEAVSAQFNGSKAYQYFLNTHNRVSINGSGGNIISFVNVTNEFDNSMDNAYWNGFAMFYGNGSEAFSPLARGLDVAGHEMTHGVVQNTANLEYYGESGALNESFADVFGAMIDRDDWLIGEDVVRLSAFPSGALRSLIDPNQGQPTLNPGWQPKHVDEQFTGPEDNNGVHINSGIPNHAFYQFANAVGKDKAEDVFYRALDKYLTKSSQFIDARIAVIQAAQDLGLTSNEIQAARNAWDAVGVFDGDGGNYQEDLGENPGEDYIIFASEDEQNLNLIRGDGTVENIPLIEGVGVKTRPSVSDNGSKIFFINGNNQIHEVTIDWQGNSFSHNEFANQNNSNWDFVAVSKQGDRLAGVRSIAENIIWVYDFDEGQWYNYDLYNPTFSDDGSTTDNVLYADVLEFDFSGNNIMYDALNEIDGVSGDLSYFDIGFINVWNANSDSPSLGEISKLFSGLPEKVSVGNATFSKNSDYIIAFDAATEVGFDPNTGNIEFNNHRVIGANLETGDNFLMYENNTFGVPTYSTDDDKIVFTSAFVQGGEIAGYDLGQFDLDASKIQRSNDATLLAERGRLATWFSNGERVLVDVLETPDGKTVEISISPNPAKLATTLTFTGDFQGEAIYHITDITGKLISSHKTYISLGEQTISLPISQLSSGLYNVTLLVGNQSATTRFVKQ